MQTPRSGNAHRLTKPNRREAQSQRRRKPLPPPEWAIQRPDRARPIQRPSGTDTRSQEPALPLALPMQLEPCSDRARLTLHDTDPITGNADRLSSLFYEFYRGYTVYSTETGACCVHGSGQGGCLRLWRWYVVFPDIEDAKFLIKWFLAHGQSAQDRMDRRVPQNVYSCLNRPGNGRKPVSVER